MQDNNSSVEKRWSDRRVISTDVKVIFHNRTYYARTRDIGLGGMFIDLNYVLIPRDAQIRIVMLQYRSKASYITFDTRVAYVTPQGYGLEFTDFKVNEFRDLQEILYDSPFQIQRKA